MLGRGSRSPYPAFVARLHRIELVVPRRDLNDDIARDVAKRARVVGHDDVLDVAMRLLRDRPPGLGEEVRAVRSSGQDVHCVVDEERVLQVLVARLRRNSKVGTIADVLGSVHDGLHYTPRTHSTRPLYATGNGTVSGD